MFSGPPTPIFIWFLWDKMGVLIVVLWKSHRALITGSQESCVYSRMTCWQVVYDSCGSLLDVAWGRTGLTGPSHANRIRI